jgi:hypothetical protein
MKIIEKLAYAWRMYGGLATIDLEQFRLTEHCLFSAILASPQCSLLDPVMFMTLGRQKNVLPASICSHLCSAFFVLNGHFCVFSTVVLSKAGHSTARELLKQLLD